MEIQFEKIYEMTLKMNEEEAVTLLHLVQNHLSDDIESPTSMAVRETIFNSLKRQGVKP